MFGIANSSPFSMFCQGLGVAGHSIGSRALAARPGAGRAPERSSSDRHFGLFRKTVMNKLLARPFFERLIDFMTEGAPS